MYADNSGISFHYFSIKTYVCGYVVGTLVLTKMAILMRTHNTFLYGEL